MTSCGEGEGVILGGGVSQEVIYKTTYDQSDIAGGLIVQLHPRPQYP